MENKEPYFDEVYNQVRDQMRWGLYSRTRNMTRKNMIPNDWQIYVSVIMPFYVSKIEERIKEVKCGE